MQCRKIVTCAPGAVKANAIKWSLYENLSNQYPGTLLRFHPDWALFLDEDSGKYVKQ